MATGVGQLSFSRSAEAEADRIGLEYMARAGYDPQAAIQLWQNMEAATAGSGQPPEFLSTHPNPGNRIEAIQAALPEVMPIRSEEHTSELQSLMRISYAVFCLKKKKTIKNKTTIVLKT